MTKRNLLFLIVLFPITIALGLLFFAQLVLDWFSWLKEGGVRELPLGSLTDEERYGNSQNE